MAAEGHQTGLRVTSRSLLQTLALEVLDGGCTRDRARRERRRGQAGGLTRHCLTGQSGGLAVLMALRSSWLSAGACLGAHKGLAKERAPNCLIKSAAGQGSWRRDGPFTRKPLLPARQSRSTLSPGLRANGSPLKRQRSRPSEIELGIVAPLAALASRWSLGGCTERCMEQHRAHAHRCCDSRGGDAAAKARRQLPR